MKRSSIVACVLAAALACGSSAALSAAEEDGSEPVLQLQYDFYDVQNGVVVDGFESRARWADRRGPGRRKPALELMGEGRLTTEALGRDGEVDRWRDVQACRARRRAPVDG